MTVWVHLPAYFFLLLTCHFSNFKWRKCSSQKGFHQTYWFEILRQRNTFFSLKKEKTKRSCFQLYLADTWNLMFRCCFNISMMLWCYMDLESTSKNPMVWNVFFLWSSKLIHAFFNKTEVIASSETLGKRTTVLHSNKFDERIHFYKSSKYAIRYCATFNFWKTQNMLESY